MTFKMAFTGILFFGFLLNAASTGQALGEAEPVKKGPVKIKNHVGRVIAVDKARGSLIVETLFYGGILKTIVVPIPSNVRVIKPDQIKLYERIGMKDIREGDYIAINCALEGNNHEADYIMVTKEEFRGERIEGNASVRKEVRNPC